MFIDRINFKGEDTRRRRYILPRKILLTKGNVTDEEKLLKEKPLQIGLNEQEVTILENRGNQENSGLLLDFGFEFHGSLRLLCAWIEEANAVQVRLCFGESAAEALSHIGQKNATNDHSPRDITVCLSMLSDNEFAQTGYRFIYMELLTRDVKVQLKAAIGVFIYRDTPYKGSFECDDPLINRIYETAAYTCHLNMQNLLWDGIKRDRLVWIGDMHPEMLTIRSVFGETELIEQSLNFIKNQTPLPEWMNGIPAYSLWWIIIVRDWYQYTGNTAFLKEQRSYVLALIQQISDHIHEDGTDSFPDYFLDWPTRGTPAAIDGVRALLAYTLDAAEQLSLYYQDEKLAYVCRSRKEAIRGVPGSCYAAKQTAAFMKLYGIIDRDKVLEKTLLSGGANGMSTFMSYYILSAIASCGQTDQALSVLKEYYGGMLEMGATTFWEDFDLKWLQNACPVDQIPDGTKSDIHGDNGAFCYKGFRHSLCHGWASGPVPFLTEQVLGIRIEEAGCKKIRIQPNLGDLQWVKGTFPTPYGMIRIEHKKDRDGSILSYICAPDGVRIIKD